MKKVLITGAAGNVGKETCRALLAEGGFAVRGTDRSRRGESVVPIEVVDLLNREDCYRLLDGVDAVVHLANHITDQHADAQTVFGENCTMNINIFQAAVECGVRQIVFASSIQAIHGTRQYVEEGEQAPSQLPYLPIDGNTPQNPGNSYGASKCATETLLEMYTRVHGISGAAIRFPWLMLTDWLPHLKRRGPRRLSPWTPLDEALTYLSYADAGRLVAAILRRPRPGMTLCQPTGPNLSVDMPVSEALKLFPNVPLRRPVEQMKTLVDLDLLREQYGWEPVDDLHALLAQTP